MFESSLTLLTVLFVIAAGVVWYAGIKISEAVDVIDHRFNIGQALGGMIFLAIVTNLPEIAIVASATWMNNVPMAIGNILGGVAIQTVILVFLDGIALGKKDSLTHRGASLQLVLEGVLLIAILAIVVMGARLPKSLIFFHLAPGDLLIVTTWLIGLWLINKARNHLPWISKGHIAQKSTTQNKNKKRIEKWSTAIVVFVFIFLAFITLLGGVALEETSRVIATHIGWSGALFGATILAAVTALPEVSTGYEAIKLEDYNLAFSDIFGGNAFLPTLFLLATILSGNSTLPQIKNTDIYLACLGILLTCVYIFGLVFRLKRQIFNLGIDSFVVLLLYIIGTIGLFFL